MKPIVLCTLAFTAGLALQAAEARPPKPTPPAIHATPEVQVTPDIPGAPEQSMASRRIDLMERVNAPLKDGGIDGVPIHINLLFTDHPTPDRDSAILLAASPSGTLRAHIIIFRDGEWQMIKESFQ